LSKENSSGLKNGASMSKVGAIAGNRIGGMRSETGGRCRREKEAIGCIPAYKGEEKEEEKEAKEPLPPPPPFAEAAADALLLGEMIPPRASEAAALCAVIASAEKGSSAAS
jgi:hypothetical protein